MSLKEVALKVQAHAESALFQLAIGVVFLYLTIAFFISSTYTEDGTKTATSVFGYIALVAGTAFSISAWLRYGRPAFSLVRAS